MIKTGITKEIYVSYREITQEVTKKLNTFFQNDDVVKSPDKFIEIIPPEFNAELRITSKLCLNRMKLDGKTEYVLKTPINELEKHEFVFMVMDMFQNSEMMLLAEEVMSYVGFPEKKIVFDRMYEDKYQPLYGYNGSVLAKLRSYYWVDNSEKPIGVINNMYINTKKGDNGLNDINEQNYRLLDGYKTYSIFHDDLLRELNKGIPTELASTHITNQYSYTYPCYNVHIINAPFPLYVPRLRREQHPTGVLNIGIPIDVDGVERFDISCDMVNVRDHHEILDMKFLA